MCLKNHSLSLASGTNDVCMIMYADACRNTFKTKTQSALKSLEDFTCFNIFSHTLRKKKQLTCFFWMICLLAWRFAGDLWSAGLILYAMCFGDLPYHSEDPAECRRQVVSHKASVTHHGHRKPRIVCPFLSLRL